MKQVRKCKYGNRVVVNRGSIRSSRLAFGLLGRVTVDSVAVLELIYRVGNQQLSQTNFIF